MSSDPDPTYDFLVHSAVRPGVPPDPRTDATPTVPLETSETDPLDRRLGSRWGKGRLAGTRSVKWRDTDKGVIN